MGQHFVERCIKTWKIMLEESKMSYSLYDIFEFIEMMMALSGVENEVGDNLGSLAKELKELTHKAGRYSDF